jgi:hypothetical protein
MRSFFTAIVGFMVSLGVVVASLTPQAKQQPNAWIYCGERNDSLFTLTVRKANKGVECAFVVKIKNEQLFCLDMGFFSALAGTELIEIDGMMSGALVYHRAKDHEIAAITIPLPKDYTGAKGSNTIGRFAKYERITDDEGTVFETPLLELCP